ncbi:MAG: virulence RhuM family protein [Bacteroidetes bacterium]|nr:virulence RhuM family protein [Bacteroidota bacterium]
MEQGELIIYQPEKNKNFQIEVRFEDETVWLNRQQLAELFDRDIKTIGKHINNALNEELKNISVVAKFATTASDGKTYQIEHYNLDMILSIGYRVKSDRGIQFRIWANKILKEYLLKGYAVHQRIERIENKVLQHDKQFDLLLKTPLPTNEGIFYEGQIYDAWDFVSRIIKTAKTNIVLIDNYVDDTVLTLLSKRKKGIKAIIYSKKLSKQFLLDLDKHNQQYEKVECFEFSKSHDRFLIIDQQTVYHIGASLKNLGKSWFAFSKINLDTKELVKKLN